MKIAILGYSRQGESAYDYWHTPGNELTICDQNPDITVPKDAQSQLGDGYLHNLDRFDLLVRTPALHPRDIVAANPDAPGILDKVTTNTNEFFRICPSRHIIGVTGTKGKGTTSTLIAKILEADGKKVHLGGNIGIAPLEMLKGNIQATDWVVLELANFQLIDIKYSPPIAVCLMVEPEHLNWHTDMAEYMEAKRQLFVHQKANDLAVYNSQNTNSEQIASTSPAALTPYMREPGAYVENNMVRIGGYDICATSELKLLGEHNWQNVCAALTAVWPVTQNTAAMRSVLTNFTGLEHRLEFVRELDGVRYYDDSFGTTPETAIVAIQAFEAPKVVILGGSDKGSDYTELAKAIGSSNVREVILIGNPSNPQHKTAASDLEAALKSTHTVVTSLVKPGGSTIEEIVQTAQQHAKKGDVVLLSTACASFDMFKDYKDRGEKFQAAVRTLPSR